MFLSSSLIHKILVEAHAAGKPFHVIVVNGRPWLERKELLRRLAKHGVECSYILINALSFNIICSSKFCTIRVFIIKKVYHLID